LIALAKVDKLFLLRDMFGEVLIPSAVYRELMAKSGPESVRLDEALADFLKPTAVSHITLEVELATAKLDRGEQQAIALASEHNALLVIDERLGRLAARRLGLAITGVVGILIQAKHAGPQIEVIPLLEEMRKKGYWLSDNVLAVAAKLSGEM
jgi:predicted nucleic acid-binding protein